MQVPRPPALGRSSVVRQLRSVLISEPILGAARVRPKGYLLRLLLHAFGWLGTYIARYVTAPLPPALLYIAVTPVDIRLFTKPLGSPYPIEMGRWKKGSYRAIATDGVLNVKLALELEGLGRVNLFAPREVRPVFELVVQGASGPAI